MNVNASNLSSASSHQPSSRSAWNQAPRVSPNNLQQEDSLEDVHPARTARMIVASYKRLFTLIFVVEIFAIFALVKFVGGIFTIVLGGFVLIGTYLHYIYLTRMAIAPLMTWHFCKENTLVTRQLLSEMAALRRIVEEQQEYIAQLHGVGGAASVQPPPSNEPITVACSGCGIKYTMTPKALRQKVACEACGTPLSL